MALTSEHLKSCGVKISTKISGVKSSGSGVLYVTSNLLGYNYILTAKHIFQEDSLTPFAEGKVGDIHVMFFDDGTFDTLDYIKRAQVPEKLITFDDDFAILKVPKRDGLNFRQVLVSDTLEDHDLDFFFWGIFSANENDLHKFDVQRDDPALRRYKLKGNHDFKFLSGISGSGIFCDDKSVLCGVVSRYPNEDFQNATIDCTRLSFSDINSKLRSLNLTELDTISSSFKREIDKNVVDIHQAFVNGACLDLELARKRLQTDIRDDWYYDPLKYIDLLNQDFIFAQLSPFLGEKKYQAHLAENFYVPKKQFTLRLALVSPLVDRLLFMAAVGTLAEKLDGALIERVYSARYNKFSSSSLILPGVEQWKKMKYKLADVAIETDENGKFRFGCLIKIDLLNFYDNINKKLLLKKIERVCNTTNEISAASLLQDILSRITDKDVGLPQNSDASSLLASFYLNQVDNFMQNHAIEYYRFMDDIRIFCSDKFEARKILQTFELELRRCYLSINSQKTEILQFTENEEIQPGEFRRDDMVVDFNIDISRISCYRTSDKQQYLNEAFHGAIALLEKNLHANNKEHNDEKDRLINYAFNTLAMLAVKKIEIDNRTILADALKTAIQRLKDRPWITSEICKLLSLMPELNLADPDYSPLMEIVLEDKYNTYSFQTYQLWLLFAKHKCNNTSLRLFATKSIEKNDDTNLPVIAAMVIYMCSVDHNYRRVILRKFEEGFTHGYFQNRIALVALRSFRPELISPKNTNETLTEASSFTNKYSDKDLVYVRGLDEEEDGEGTMEQLYSP